MCYRNKESPVVTKVGPSRRRLVLLTKSELSEKVKGAVCQKGRFRP